MVKRRDKGFTLIELLVVIAIIAILAAILFPVFARAKAFSKVSKCLSNLRQISDGIQMYTDENGGRFPLIADFGPVATQWKNGRKGAVVVLRPYIRVGITKETDFGEIARGIMYKSVGFFACPADEPGGKDLVRGNQNTITQDTVWEQTGWSYHYFASDFCPIINGVAVGAPMCAVSQPTKKSIVADVWNWHCNEFVATDQARRNTLFVDGHAARIHMKDWWASRRLPMAPWY
jgi:prepilin-type N-terminal cleavage/methylation domain-containing protein/prepilin-type processing-associated H-X9-DG protein